MFYHQNQGANPGVYHGALQITWLLSQGAVIHGLHVPSWTSQAMEFRDLNGVVSAAEFGGGGSRPVRS